MERNYDRVVSMSDLVEVQLTINLHLHVKLLVIGIQSNRLKRHEQARETCNSWILFLLYYLQDKTGLVQNNFTNFR